MRSLRFALVFALLLIPLVGQVVPAEASWEGAHRFSVAVQGSLTTMDQLNSLSQSIPVEFRSTISITVDPPNSAGEYYGRLRITDAYVHQDGGMASVPVPSNGYRIRLTANEPPEVLDNAALLSAYGVELSEILAMLFPVAPSQPLVAGNTWSTQYTQAIQVDQHALTMPIQNTFTVNEVRESVVVIQSSLRGSASRDLNPGRLISDQLGSGVIHVDPTTGQLLRSAVTVRSNIERTIPTGATVAPERSVVRALITTSIERLETVPIQVPSLGAQYTDPAGRFSLRLPEGWSTSPIHVDRTLTLFASDDQTKMLYVDIAPASAPQEAHDLAQAMLSQYERFLIDFSLVTEPVNGRLGQHPASFTEYRYIDGAEVYEASLYTQIDGYNVALQYSVPVEQGAGEAGLVLERLSEHFTFGPHPQGFVPADQLFMSPFILYESVEYAFELEVPMLWPPMETQPGATTFVELGGAGRVNIHLESVAPTESAVTLLTQWLSRLEAETAVNVISRVEQAALGPLSGAATVIEWTDGTEAIRQKVVSANWDGILFVVTMEYDGDGFDERAAIFERILSSFRPRPEFAMAQALTFDAYNPPPAPEGEAPFVMIGRLLHEFPTTSGITTRPGQEIRIDLSVNGRSYTALTDGDGFFYGVNLPVAPGDVISIDGIRGALFNLPYDVNIPIDGLTLTVTGQVGFIGELVLVLETDTQRVHIRPESGFDIETGVSRVHQAFLSRYPDSAWAEIVRGDLDDRLGS